MILFSQPLANSWASYYENHPQNETANRAIDKIAECTAMSAAVEDRANAFLEIPDNIALYYENVSHTIQLVHRITKLGGNRLQPIMFHCGLTGMGNRATAIQFNMDDMTSSLATAPDETSIKTPTWTSLKSLSNKEAVLSAVAPANNGFILNQCRAILIPPFLVQVIIHQTDMSPGALLPEIIAALKEFDSENSGEASYPKAMDNCRHIVQFLWAAAHKLIPSASFVPSTNQPDIQKWADIQHNNFIIPPVIPTPGPSDSTMSSLAANLERQTEVIQAQHLDKKKILEDKKCKFAKLFAPVQDLILNASSTNDEARVEAPTLICEEFFACSDSSKAHQFLCDQFRKARCIVDLKMGTSTALHAGHLLRTEPTAPSNFSLFHFPKQKPLAPSSDDLIMSLSLKAQHGNGWDTDDINKALKTGSVIASSIDEFVHQLTNFKQVSIILFSKFSPVSEAILTCIRHIQAHQLIYESLQKQESTFIARLAYSIDNHIFNFLLSCYNAGSVLELADRSFLDFKTIHRDILCGNFSGTLPPTMRILNTNEDPPSPGGPNRKRQKRPTEDKKDSERHTNRGALEELRISQEVWHAKCRGQNIEGRPKGCCTRFHLLGYCYENCSNSDKHIPTKEIPKSKINELKAYICKQTGQC